MRTRTALLLRRVFYGGIPGYSLLRARVLRHDLFFVLGTTVDHDVVHFVWIFADAHPGLEIFPVDPLRVGVDSRGVGGARLVVTKQ